jgi:gamma-glutamyl-gamma-aminobutyrate hydrolase PuuD
MQQGTMKMGKRGNQRRKEKRVANQEELEMSYPADTQARYEEQWERVFGKRGPPTDDNTNVLYLPKPEKKDVFVDLLGRVHTNTEASMQLPSQTPTGRRLLSDERYVVVKRDIEVEYPELWMEIFVAGDPMVRDDEARFAKMFARSRCSRAKSVLESDIVIFGGGSDVDPALYGEEKHCTTHFDSKRDDDDIALYQLCLENGIPMFGVCRGAQFLSVMNGGKLYQDIDNHYGDHKIWDVNRRFHIDKVSSVHHQMCRPNVDGGMEIIATNSDGRNRSLNPGDRKIGPCADIEAFFYRDTCCIGVQGHPEYSGYPYYTKWCLELINELVLANPDIEWRDKNRRIKLDLLEERKIIAPKKETE